MGDCSHIFFFFARGLSVRVPLEVSSECVYG